MLVSLWIKLVTYANDAGSQGGEYGLQTFTLTCSLKRVSFNHNSPDLHNIAATAHPSLNMAPIMDNNRFEQAALEQVPKQQLSESPREVSIVSSPGEKQSLGEESAQTMIMQVSKSRGIAIITTLAGINFLNTMGSGLLIAVLPHIARDVGLSDSLILCKLF